VGAGSTKANLPLEAKDAGSVAAAEDSTALSVSSLVEESEVMPFKEYAFDVLMNNPIKVDMVKGNALSCGAITMFAERGVCSGHYYQHPMNHHQVNFSSYTESCALVDRITVPPLLVESMVRPTEGASFSVGNLMSLSCYEVIVSNNPGLLYPTIDSLVPLAITLANESSNESTVLTGRIKGCCAKVLMPKAWEHSLEVCGWK
jgi:hypothetical protein